MLIDNIYVLNEICVLSAIKLYHRDAARHLIKMQNLPLLYAVKSGKHSFDVVTGGAVPYMVNIPTYQVNMSATVTLSTGDVAVLDMWKFLKRLRG
ncbi:MAG: hypothetical protein KAT90_10040 [Gammaproteobacteria bacterium]|nr:hypothetical protein [Gammaproteobacteria bacterium]